LLAPRRLASLKLGLHHLHHAVIADLKLQEFDQLGVAKEAKQDFGRLNEVNGSSTVPAAKRKTKK
jgi:hypothetical protein